MLLYLIFIYVYVYYIICICMYMVNYDSIDYVLRIYGEIEETIYRLEMG